MHRGHFVSGLTLLALALSGCHHDHSHDPGHAGPGGHGHGHGEDDGKTDAITVFSDRHELFIEHPFLQAGKAATFITHVTDIVARRPRIEGPVTFVLQLGDDSPIEHEVPKVARAGIYLPEITFPKAGEWKVALRIPTADGDDLVPLPNRTVYATEEEIEQAPEPEAMEGISFLKEQQWKLDFDTKPVTKRAVVERLQLPGRLVAPASGQAIVSPPVAGRLLPPADGQPFPRLGQRVEAGQVMARVQPPLAGSDHLTLLSGRQQLTSLRLELRTKAAEAKTEVTRARVAFRRAEQQLARVRDLAAKQAKSRREVEQAEYEHARAQADVQAAEARQRVYADIEHSLVELPEGLAKGFPTVALEAPISGTIVEARGTLGENVSAGTALFTLLDGSRLLLEVRVPETALERISKDLDIVFTTPGRRDRFRDIEGGRLLLPPRTVDPVTRTARLVLEMPNPGDLVPGLAVAAHVATRSAKDALAIPTSALVEEEGRYVAFVMLGGETFEKRALNLGVRDGSWVQVESGLAAGERVVTRGAYAVKLASVSTAIPAHGHAH